MTARAIPPLISAAVLSLCFIFVHAQTAPVNILLLDRFNTRFEDMAFARYSLKKLLESSRVGFPRVLLGRPSTS